jgi:hypothetical protein
MVRLLAALTLASCLFAQEQSATYVYASNQYHQNTTFAVRDGEVRIDFRITNLASGYQFMLVFASALAFNISGDVAGCYSQRDANGTVWPIGTNFLAGKTAIRGRIQRLSKKWYCEIWDDEGTDYAIFAKDVSDAAVWTDPTYTRLVTGGYVVGGTLNIAVANSNSRIDWLRVYSTTIPVRSKRPMLGDTAGDLANYEFNGNAADTSGNGRTLTATGTPTYNTSTTGAPISIPRSGEGILPDAALKAGKNNTLGNWSVCRTNLACSSYYWTQISGPSTLSWPIGRTTQNPVVAGVVATTGTDYVLQLEVTDSAGVKATTSITLGAVAVDANNIVILTSAVERNLLGSLIADGANPWTFMDWNQREDSDILITRLASEFRYQPYWLATKTGTVSVNNGSPTVTGSGTNFRTQFDCEGSVVSSTNPVLGTSIITWTSGPKFSANLVVGTSVLINGFQYFVTVVTSDTVISVNANITATGLTFRGWNKIVLPYLHIDGSTGYREFTVSACADDVTLTITGGPLGNTWDKANLSAVSYAFGSPLQGGGWSSDGNNFYDNVKGLWAMWRRSGLSKYRTAARTLAQRFYAIPYWDAQEWASAGAGEYRFPRDQAHAGLWLIYHDDNAAFGANFPVRMGAVTTDAISREAGYLSEPVADTREVGYMMQSAQFVANWHPTSGNRTAAQTFVDNLMTKFSISAGAAGGFPTTGNITTATTFSPTNGSPIVPASGANVPGTICSTPFYATGTVSFSTGSPIMTGAGGASWDSTHLNKQIEVYATGGTGAARTWRSYVISVDSATQITMAHNFDQPNLTGLSYALYSAGAEGYKQIQFGVSRFVQDTSAYTCTRNSNTQITLSRSYEGTTAVGLGYWSNEFPGTGYQALTNNIGLDAMATVAQYSTGATATAAAGYRTQIMDYLQRDGDGRVARYKGASYWAPSARCGTDITKDVMCSGFSLFTAEANRDFGLDGIGPIAAAYLAAPTAGRLAIADETYTASFGMLGYAAPFTGDGSTGGIMIPGSFNFANGKAYGQPYGVGMSSAWPAARLGGVAAVDQRTVQMLVSAVAGDSAVDIMLTPVTGGAPVAAPCSSTATGWSCPLSVDFRTGRYLFAVRRTNATGSRTGSTTELSIK